MSKLILDAAMRARLSQVTEVAELYDESGHTVGFFLTQDAYMKLQYALARAYVCDEELEQARQEYPKSGGVTTQEILAHLKSLRN